MKAIIYESNSGFTKKYADFLSFKTGYPAYTIAEAKLHLKRGDEIIFFGWMLAGSVKGFKKASKKYKIHALCAVGMAVPADHFVKEIKERYHIIDLQVFYLQGGFDMKKLHGIYRFMMKTMARFVGKSMAAKENKTDEEIAMLDMMKNGGDYVKEENLDPILSWMEYSIY